MPSGNTRLLRLDKLPLVWTHLNYISQEVLAIFDPNETKYPLPKYNISLTEQYNSDSQSLLQ